jgi:hypothetical protein
LTTGKKTISAASRPQKTAPKPTTATGPKAVRKA